ncbi:MAG TPA: HD domain-containing protein [Candidatus Paceibacterota bacterium]|nr:HD domain-containing protein [Candidatus Paceibacterota bacterium]
MYSYQIEKAVQAAAALHHNQYRKGPVPIPYVTHVFSVFLLVQDYTPHEDTATAALLHDTLEDTDYTEAALREDFSDAVANIVLAVSEDTSINDWVARKKEYVRSVAEGGEAALIISAADKIHNMRSMIEQYHDDVPGYLEAFSRYATDGLVFLENLQSILTEQLDNAIVAEFQHVYSEFNTFNQHVNEQKNS